MKPKTITFQKTFPIAMYGINERVGMEFELEEGEDALEKMKELKALVMKCAPELPVGTPENTQWMNDEETKEFHKYREERMQQPERTPEVPKTREQMIEGMIKSISTCAELKVLTTYNLLAKKYPEIQEAYDKKLKEFA